MCQCVLKMRNSDERWAPRAPGRLGRQPPHQRRGDHRWYGQQPRAVHAAADQHQPDQQRADAQAQVAGADVCAHPEAALLGWRGLGNQRRADRVEQRRADARRQHGQTQAAEARHQPEGGRATARQQDAGPRHPAAFARAIRPVAEQWLQERGSQLLDGDQRGAHAQGQAGLGEQDRQQGRQDVGVAVVDAVPQRQRGRAEDRRARGLRAVRRGRGGRRQDLCHPLEPTGRSNVCAHPSAARG